MTEATASATPPDGIDAMLLSIMANRVDGIVREMTNTLLRASRSAVIASARDMSCAIVTADNELLATAEGLPVHIFGSHLQTLSMQRLHPDLAPGDAFLHNDPYMGNTHPADHTILVPVFVDGEHMFTVCAKSHQADTGNATPTTYVPYARDVYEEGGLIFPCVRVQRDYRMVEDIVRMCRRRIRVPDQWYGDFLAAIGSARVGERRLVEFCRKYGKARVRAYIAQWLDYAEKRTAQAICRMPRATITHCGAHDPIPGMPDGIPINCSIEIDPDEGRILIDLRDNIDCLDNGFNVCEACAINNSIAGVMNCLDPDIPRCHGVFRRVNVLLRDGAVVGRTKFPHSASVATTNVGDRLVNLTQSALAQLGEGYGLAEGGVGMGAGWAVVSGRDFRRDGEPYINQLFVGGNGGPASPQADGWLTYGIPVAAGLIYRDSVELVEVKHPLHMKSVRIHPGTCAPGKFRGAPGAELIYGPKQDPTTVAIPCDGQVFPPKGVNGGHDSPGARTFKVNRDGSEERLPGVAQVTLEPGEWLRGIDNSGGGYGHPCDRDPQRVLHDVAEKWETPARARAIYGVALVEDDGPLGYAVDEAGTEALRSSLRAAR